MGELGSEGIEHVGVSETIQREPPGLDSVELGGALKNVVALAESLSQA